MYRIDYYNTKYDCWLCANNDFEINGEYASIEEAQEEIENLIENIDDDLEFRVVRFM